MKRTALASVENLNQDLEKKNQEIAYYMKTRAGSLAENSLAQQSESIRHESIRNESLRHESLRNEGLSNNPSMYLILKELEDIKDTLKVTMTLSTFLVTYLPCLVDYSGENPKKATIS